jgi:predicted amidohydrolase YtcJ
MAAGVPVAASSDAPYASPDPWMAMAAAVDRKTRGGVRLGPGERVTRGRALAMFLGSTAAPGGPPRRVAVGAQADLCLLAAPLAEALASPAAAMTRATIIGGAVVFAA